MTSFSTTRQCSLSGSHVNTFKRLAPQQDIVHIWNLTISHAAAGYQKLGDVGTVLIKRWPAVFQMMKKLCNFVFSLLSCCSACQIQASMVLFTSRCVVLCPSSDIRSGYCYTSVLNGRCANQNSQPMSKIQCCCDSGRCWADGSLPEMCPIPGTGGDLLWW